MTAELYVIPRAASPPGRLAASQRSRMAAWPPPEIAMGIQKHLTDDRAEKLDLLLQRAKTVELSDFGNTP